MRHRLNKTPAPIPIGARLVYPEIPIPAGMAFALPVSCLLSGDEAEAGSSSPGASTISVPPSNCSSPPSRQIFQRMFVPLRSSGSIGRSGFLVEATSQARQLHVAIGRSGIKPLSPLQRCGSLETATLVTRVTDVPFPGIKKQPPIPQGLLLTFT
jgi:hypothetical protein